MAKYVEKTAAWLRWIVPEEFNDIDLFRIVTFYVFHSPCLSLTSMGKSLEEYGWSTPWRKPYYLNRQLRQAATNFNLIYSANTYDSLESALDKADLNGSFPSDFGRERIAIYDNMNNQFLSVFYHLRNAFAHCRINMIDFEGDCVFILEDIVPNQKDEHKQKLAARMIIRKSTLLKWIDIIEEGEKVFNSTITKT